MQGMLGSWIMAEKNRANINSLKKSLDALRMTNEHKSCDAIFDEIQKCTGKRYSSSKHRLKLI
jgi:hypothetical protein